MITPRGIAVAVAAAVATALGWLLGYRPLLVPAVGAVTALVAGALLTWWSAPLRVRREIAPLKVERGGLAVGVVRVANDGGGRDGSPRRGRRRSRPVAAVDRVGDREVAVAIPGLAPGAAHTATYQLPTTRRGLVPVGPLTTRRTDPFGVFRRVRSHGGQVGLLVRPRVVELGVPASGRSASVEGPAARSEAGGTVTFHSLREYVFGDDLRHIHWRSTARAGTLMVRRLVDVSEPRTVVVLDTARAGYPTEEAFELAVDIAASVAAAVLRDGFPLTLLTGDDKPLMLKGGRAQTDLALDHLALVKAGEQTLAGALRRLAAAPPPGGAGALVVVGCALGRADVERIVETAGDFERAVLARVGSASPDLGVRAPFSVMEVADMGEFVAAWEREARR